jgi:UDP-2,3-diacylglucosamine pyrophosphatase LpxH
MGVKEETMSKKRVILMSDIHYNCADWFGIDRKESIEQLCADLAKEYAKAPVDAVLLLGDYSLDFWAWDTKGCYINEGVSRTRQFVKQYLGRLVPDGVSMRMIAGNHEQYGEALWREMTGYPRRDHIVIGDILFILSDTFGADLDPTEHSDGTYCGADVAEIRELMSRYPNKKVILCAHWFDMDMESEDFRELLRNEDRILCLFCGHNHRSAVANTGEDAGNKPIGYTGQYSYSNEPNMVRSLHGYRLLEFDEKELSCRYIVHPHRYRIGDVYFTNEYSEQDKLEISF